MTIHNTSMMRWMFVLCMTPILFACAGKQVNLYDDALNKLEQQDYAGAIKLLTSDDLKDDPRAQTKLGNLYLYGDGVPADKHEAILLFEKAASQNYPEAQYNLGIMFKTSMDMLDNEMKAFKAFRKAADMGYPAAFYELGNMYYKSNVVQEDLCEALKLYSRALNLHNSKVEIMIQKITKENPNLACKD